MEREFHLMNQVRPWLKAQINHSTSQIKEKKINSNDKVQTSSQTAYCRSAIFEKPVEKILPSRRYTARDGLALA